MLGANAMNNMMTNLSYKPGGMASATADPSNTGCLGMPGGGSADAEFTKGGGKGKGKGKGKAGNDVIPKFGNPKKAKKVCLGWYIPVGGSIYKAIRFIPIW